MRSSFLVGMALGALAGMVVLESSSSAKQLFYKGKQMIQDKMGANQND